MSQEEITAYLSFRLAEETFAVHVNHVQSIMEMVEITHIPDAPHYMLGVINLRGEVLPVIDAREKLHMQVSEFTTRTSIIVLEVNIGKQAMRIGALVDDVLEVFNLERNEMKQPPELGSHYKSAYIVGMVEHENKFTLILNVNKIFSSEDLIELQDTAQGADLDLGGEETQGVNL